MNHRDLNKGLAVLHVFFVIFGQPATSTQPTKGSLDNPPTRQDVKASSVIAAFDDLKRPSAECLQPWDEFSPVATVGPDERKAGILSFGLLKHQLRTVTILDIRGMYNDGKDQANCVHENVTFSTLYLFTSVIPSIAFFFPLSSPIDCR